MKKHSCNYCSHKFLIVEDMILHVDKVHRSKQTRVAASSTVDDTKPQQHKCHVCNKVLTSKCMLNIF